MIKGVNKRVVEINNPDSIYFEKATFYLKPGVSELPQRVAETEIHKYIENLGLLSAKPYRKKSKKLILCLISIALALAITGLIIFLNNK